MKVVSQMRVRKSPELRSLCHKAKNLWNVGLFYINMYYETMEKHLGFYDLRFMLKEHDCYKALPSAVSGEILYYLSMSWKSFFNKNIGKTRPPKYKEKDGENVLYFNYRAFSVTAYFISFAKKCLPDMIPTRPIIEMLRPYQRNKHVDERRGSLCMIRVIPNKTHYLFEFVYERPEQKLKLRRKNVIGIDLGVNNIATCVSNTNLRPFIVSGGIPKSINQFYNKQRAKV